MTLTTLIAELEEAERAATPGPWYTFDWQDDHGENLTTVEAREDDKPPKGYASVWPGAIRHIRVAETEDGNRPIEDARLIALMRTHLPALIEAVKRQGEELSVLRRLAPEYFQWPGKDGVNTAPEWLQHRLKYGGANADGDMLAVYDWLDRRSLAAPGDYVVDGEKGLFVMPARAALKEATDV